MRSLLALCALLSSLASIQGASARSARLLAVTALTHRVARVYHGTHVRVTYVEHTVTDSVPHKPMYFIRLSGAFHKGRFTAHVLYFSALADRSHIWGIVAYDGHNHVVWSDPVLPHGQHHANRHSVAV